MTLAAVLAIEAFSRTAVYEQDFRDATAVVLLALVVISALRNGPRGGLASAMIALLYNEFSLSIPGETIHYPVTDARRVLIISAILPSLGGVVGRLRGRIHALLSRGRAVRAEAEEVTEELQGQAAQLQEQASELEALNEELTAASAQLRAIINSSLDAIIGADARSVITEWNHHAELIFGWTAAEAIGRTLTETIIPPRYREAHESGVARLLLTGEGRILNRRIEITALHRDGHEFPVELTVALIRSGSGMTFSAFVRDLTEAKIAARRRSAEHEVTRVLAESHTLEEAAPRILHAIGDALEWEVGVFWTVDSGGELLRRMGAWNAPSAPARGFAAATAELTFARGVGLPGRVWETGNPVWIKDVALQAEFPRAALAAEAGLHGAFAFPIRAGQEMLGVIEFFHRQVLTPDRSLLETAEAIGGDIGLSVRRVRAEEERDRALESMLQANDQLSERTSEAETANRAKGDFLATISHELRTPLNAIIGYSELILMAVPEPIPDATRKQVTRIRESSRHLLELIEEVLSFARVEAEKEEVDPAPTDAVAVAREAARQLEPAAEGKGLHLQVDVPDTPVQMDTDGAKMRRILVNLLSNAVKFTDEGEVRLGVKDAGAEVVFTVTDTGLGIPAEALEQIFEPFRQVDQGTTRRAGGTGLGLSVSRRLAQLLGGTIAVESVPRRGSTFTLRLPRRMPALPVQKG